MATHFRAGKRRAILAEPQTLRQLDALLAKSHAYSDEASKDWLERNGRTRSHEWVAYFSDDTYTDDLTCSEVLDLPNTPVRRIQSLMVSTEFGYAPKVRISFTRIGGWDVTCSGTDQMVGAFRNGFEELIDRFVPRYDWVWRIPFFQIASTFAAAALTWGALSWSQTPSQFVRTAFLVAVLLAVAAAVLGALKPLAYPSFVCTVGDGEKVSEVYAGRRKYLPGLVGALLVSLVGSALYAGITYVPPVKREESAVAAPPVPEKVDEVDSKAVESDEKQIEPK